MDLEGIILSEIRKKKTHTIWFHFYVESKQNKTNKQNKNRLKETGTKGKLPEKGWGYGNK